jgi:flagella basal body P-ring formation protein FlgA
LGEYSKFPVPDGDPVFRQASLRPDRPDGSRLLSGHVVYAPGRQVPIWARVRARDKPLRVVAARDLTPGVLLTAADFRLAEVELGSAAGLASPEAIVGMAPRRLIRAGTTLAINMLRRPLEVARGETVRVKVRSGAAKLSFQSVAESGGFTGEWILVKNPVSGQRFRAKVDAQSQVSIELPLKEASCCR